MYVSRFLLFSSDGSIWNFLAIDYVALSGLYSGLMPSIFKSAYRITEYSSSLVLFATVNFDVKQESKIV